MTIQSKHHKEWK